MAMAMFWDAVRLGNRACAARPTTRAIYAPMLAPAWRHFPRGAGSRSTEVDSIHTTVRTPGDWIGRTRISGEGIAVRFWRADSAWIGRLQCRTGIIRRIGTGRMALGRQGANPFRRQRQGGRDQALQDLP